MERQLKYSEEAKAGFESILEYIAFNFGERTAEQYLAGFDWQIQAIINQPGIRHRLYVEGIGLVHRAIFKTYTQILYTFSDTEIQILAVVDARTDWQGSNLPA